MKKAIEIYKDDIKDSYFSIYDYQPMLNEFGNILIQVDDGGYQGDSRVLYEKDGKYGWLQFGWGSCSGCDALQACGNIEEAQKLMDELYESIKWFDNAKEALDFFEKHDWKGDYSWSDEEQNEFVEKAVKKLKELSEVK